MVSAPPTVHPVDWARSASLYEVNLRHHTAQGTIAAFAGHLPRLHAMGVDIVWLMPIQPPGVKHRKGGWGSPYAVRDYCAVNPDFGTLDDLRRLVAAAHAQGMHVLLDWVANHTAWDHPWVDEHPDWYRKNAQGEIGSCEYDNGREIEHWTDVVGLDYRQPALWPAMTAALEFWVREADIDGYRCDVAGLVPAAFWQQARAALDRIKPVFMLAEASDPALHDRAFDMGYDWATHDLLRALARGQGDARELLAGITRDAGVFPHGTVRMQFTSNHDKNAWEGSDSELWGATFEVFAVLAATLPGMPLILAGQETGLARRLPLFEKDTIDWSVRPHEALYTRLLTLKHRHPVLWNGAAGAPATLLPCSDRSLLAFRRGQGGDAVTVVANLSDQSRQVRIDDSAPTLSLPPWSWSIDAPR